MTRSGLAIKLAPPVAPKSIAVPVVGLAGAAFFAAVGLMGMASGQPGTDAGCLLVVLAPVIVVLALVVRSRQQRLRLDGPVVAYARVLWDYCWYCGRCGIVTLPLASGAMSMEAAGLANRLIAIARQSAPAGDLPRIG